MRVTEGARPTGKVEEEEAVEGDDVDWGSDVDGGNCVDVVSRAVLSLVTVFEIIDLDVSESSLLGIRSGFTLAISPASCFVSGAVIISRSLSS